MSTYMYAIIIPALLIAVGVFLSLAALAFERAKNGPGVWRRIVGEDGDE